MLEDWLPRFRAGDRVVLSRLLSLVMRADGGLDILTKLGPPAKPSRVVAVTGSGGVGKSTLVGKLIERFRASGQTIAVLACDPQSPLSGGALLGDRFRMSTQTHDDGVFIRSIAAASGHGAVALHLADMVRLLEAFGFDLVLIETVGAGQGDTAVRPLVDVLVLLLQPETGDDLQWEKAGVLEVADVVVVHKADLPGAELVEQQVLGALHLSGEAPVKILRVSARAGDGVADLVEAINAAPLRRGSKSADSRDLLRLAQERLNRRFAALESNGDARLQRLQADWHRGTLDREQAMSALLALLASDGDEKERA